MNLHATINENGLPIGLAVTSPPPPFPPHKEITGRLVKLVPLSSKLHAETLWKEFSVNDKIWTYLPVGPFSDFDSFKTHLLTLDNSTDPQYYSIIDLQSSQPVGSASYLRISPSTYSIEVGWLTFSPRLQKTPLATEAMHLMAKNAFDLGYRRYEWKCHAFNQPSINAAQRLGFSFEGIHRNNIVVKGRNRDTAWFSIIDSDWPSISSAHLSWLSPSNFDENGRQLTSLSTLTSPFVYTRFPNLTMTRSQQVP